MSILSQEPAHIEGGSSFEAEPEAPADDAASRVNEQEAKPVERVEIKPAPTGRRAQARAASEDLAKQVTELRDTFTKTQEELRSSLAAKDQELARLRGSYEALQPIVQRQQQMPAAPTPDEIEKEAIKALDANDFQTYHRKTAEAIRMRTVAELQGMIPQPPPQMHPAVTALVAQHPAVAAAGKQGLDLAAAYDNVLAANGSPDSTDRWRRAFEMAQNDLAKKSPSAASFNGSQTQRDSLAGIPTGRPSSGAAAERAPGITLNEWDMRWMRAADMTKDEYVRYLADHQQHRIEK